MFGMLDYRAHKLYRVLVYPVEYLLLVLTFFVPATAAYFFTLWITKDALLFPLTLFVAWTISGLPWSLITWMFLAVPKSIFNFLIDPIPTDGRTKEEALAVVMRGQRAILVLKFQKPASQWSDEDIEALSKITLLSRFFRYKIEDRFHRLRNYYCGNPHITQSEYETNKILKEWGLAPTLIELIFTKLFYGGLAIHSVILLLIIIYAPR